MPYSAEYWAENKRFMNLMNTNLSFDELNGRKLKYKGVFREGLIFGNWWIVEFSGTGMGEITTKKRLEDLIFESDSFDITIQPTGFIHVLHYYQNFYTINLKEPETNKKLNPGYIDGVKIHSETEVRDLTLYVCHLSIMDA